ncbi:MAG: XRE family transcriptional regulator [Verrucomicrobiaceae bacterium]|nr:MAG: XRE family transcriptional regulator [Verrucomicrobiaceae bacterium]
MDTHDVASILSRIRESGLTQMEISKRTGIPQPRLSRWEAGNAPSSANDALALLTLAENLGVESSEASAQIAAADAVGKEAAKC